jgi:hypothetical protein
MPRCCKFGLRGAADTSSIKATKKKKTTDGNFAGHFQQLFEKIRSQDLKIELLETTEFGL